MYHIFTEINGIAAYIAETTLLPTGKRQPTRYSFDLSEARLYAAKEGLRVLENLHNPHDRRFTMRWHKQGKVAKTTTTIADGDIV